MWRNYIKVAFRNLVRDKGYSIINIAGLSVGVACCLLLALYVYDETTYDKHHNSADNLYRVTSRISKANDEGQIMRTTSPPIVWGIKDEIPEIELVTRFVSPPTASKNLIRYEDNQFYEPDGYIADSTFFKLFTYDFKEGDAATALKEANSVVINEDIADKLFGKESALNKVININQGGPGGDFRITGVLSRKQGNSHIDGRFYIAMHSSGWAEYMRNPSVTDEWAGQNFVFSYMKLRAGTDPASVIPKMNAAFQRHAAEDLKALGFSKTLGLEAVKDVYLYSAHRDANPRVTYLYVIGSIALVILLIACINFMNLTTAKATKRASEVGLRKTLGAYRTSLIAQFLGEVMIIVTVAIALSLILVQLLLPYFNHLTMKQIAFDSENVRFFVIAIFSIMVITGLLAGSYPAFYLSSFQPAKVLKGKVMLSNSGGLLRRSLVVFQFVVAIMLVCGMIVISQQLDYMQAKDLGFEAMKKVIVPLRTETAQNNHEVLRNTFSGMPSVNRVTGTNYTPGSYIWNDFSLYPEGSNMDQAVMVKNTWIEPNYLDVMGIKLIAGRNFTKDRETESQNRIILNKIAVKELGFTPEEIVGRELYTEWQGERRTYFVIGVMDDYHQVSVKEEVFPILFRVPSEVAQHDYMILDMKGDQFQEAISGIESAWKKINPDTPFEYSFLDDDIRKLYDEDKRVAGVITSFTTIAIIISCLGLYGLSTYMAERRFKEIGVRKVMGASVRQIMAMMSSEFVSLVLIAFVIAVPISWYAITKWLDNFAYKVSVGATVFVAAGLSALIIAVITVSFQSFKAANANPVQSLRNE